MKTFIKILFLALVALLIVAAFYIYPRYILPGEPVDIFTDEGSDGIETTLKIEKEQQPKPIPTSYQLDALFIPQAPFQDWSEPWQNACEEAALLVAHHYLKGDTQVPPTQAKQEILDMLAWQDEYFGSHKDLTAAEVGEMAEEYFGHQQVEVTYDITLDDIKREVAAGHPVVIPAAGRILNNPNFTAPGPVYHMLTAIGYTEGTIITNDPGTRKGAGFIYTNDNFYNSIHDFVEGTNGQPALMKQGRKAMIVIEH